MARHPGDSNDAGARGLDELDAFSLSLLLFDRIRRRTRTNPMSTLAGAVGLGYVLGGGVPDFVVRIGGSMALRAASQRITGDVLGAYASASVNAPKSPPQADPVAPPRTRSTGTG